MVYLKKYGVYGLFVLLLLGLYFFQPQPEVIVIDETPDIIQDETSFIYVDLKGQVVNPGVYKLEEGMRLFQAINLAGGLTVEANDLKVNLSQMLRDQDIIYIPSIHDKEEIIDEIIDSPNDFLIDINQASLEQLETLPGIGPTTAQKIIDYRTEVAYFETIEEIMNVTGIGESTFEEIKDLITV